MLRRLLSNWMRSFLEWVVSKMARPRIIFDRAGGTPYLSRYYLFGRPKMPDGSQVFDQFGNPHPEAVWPAGGLGLYIHKFHRSDDDFDLHNHPWSWALSIVLAGGYVEERRDGNDIVRVRRVKPFSINFIRATDFHRVDLIEKDAWSLFIAGPKIASWAFWNRDTGETVPWREFIAKKRGTWDFPGAVPVVREEVPA